MEGCESRVRIERESSIDLEPRTLTLDQLQCARKAALCVLSTKTMDEAINIFTEGLKPVLGIKGMDLCDNNSETNQLSMEHLNFPSFQELRDIVSAPF